MKIALAQINPTVGQLSKNEALHASAIQRAIADGAQLLVFPEMSILGYPPRDLVARQGVVEACAAAVARLASIVPASMLVLIGLPIPARTRPFANALALVRGGRIEGFAVKQLLPSYDVFDEDRHYEAGAHTTVIEHANERIAVMLCEDFWQGGDVAGVRTYARDPVAQARAQGATVIAVASASPFVAGKEVAHETILAARARESGVIIVSVNAVGANDDLVFDGGSRVLARDGSALAQCARFREDFTVIDSDCPRVNHSAPIAKSLDLDAERFHACVLGTRDYFGKTGHQRAVLGLSGGIDSALVAAIAAAAIGAENVTGLLMPSRYSSQGSIDEAHDSARLLRLGRIETFDIDPIHRAYTSTVTPMFDVQGLTDENLQSRVRGVLLMLASNASGALVLTTGNKSEHATGYATLYGDMNGALGPIGDLYKTQVYAMANMLNARFDEFGFARAPIPMGSITKAPSAELREDQTDQDSLPPYEILDAVLQVLIEGEGTIAHAMTVSGADEALVTSVARMLDRNQFKRDQAPVILKLSTRAFGRGRRFPICAGSGR